MKETPINLSRRDFVQTAGTAILLPTGANVINRENATAQEASEQEIVPERIGLPEFHKGINALAYYKDETGKDYESRAKQLAQRLIENNVNSVNYVYPIYQEDPYTTEVFQGKDSPTKENKRAFIRSMHEKGLPVTLRPSLDEASLVPFGHWRGDIAPIDIDAWIASYTALVVADAELAEEEQADGFCMGLELSSMELYPEKMIGVVDAIRSKFSGKVVYSFNYNTLSIENYERMMLAEQLDEAWIDAFYQRFVDPLAPVDVVAQSWIDPLTSARQIQDTLEKPVVFSEVGIMDDPETPWVWSSQSNTETTNRIQARNIEAICQNLDLISGMHIWNAGLHADINALSDADPTFDVLGRPAEAAMQECYSQFDDEGERVEATE